MNSETITAIALGIGLSASCGFRVFVPLLVASIAARSGIIPLQESFVWLGSWPAIICFGVATIVEIMAYYIPFVDNLLDTITTPLAIGAGSLLMTSVLPIDSEMMKWVTGIIIGGGAAATIQGGSVIARLGSSKLTAGLGNPVVATGEHAAAFGTSILALVMPVFVALVFIFLAGFIFMKFGNRLFGKK
ncbi:MAG TPA: DUF4126 domain-containing protein [Bacteroidales bacterium]|jgi:hypothetical protein|nr:DUF4126 domain-containing protein [Bacteroidales bacterium]